MATGKSPSGNKTTTQKRPARAKRPASAKKPPEATIIEAPKKDAAGNSAKQAGVIEGKAVDVTPRGETPEPKPAPETAEAQETDAREAAGSFRPAGAMAALFAGGVAAAGMGYLVALAILPQQMKPEPVQTTSDPAILKQLADIEARLSVLESGPDVGRLVTTLKELRADMSDGNATLDDRLASAEAHLVKIDATIGALPTVAPSDSGSPVASTDALAALQGEIMRLKANIEALQVVQETLAQRLDGVSGQMNEVVRASRENTQAAKKNAQSIEQSLAGERLRAAIVSGRPFASLLDDLAAQRGADIPAALSGTSQTGVPSIGVLQSGFAGAARSALKASLRDAAGDGFTSRFMAFLKSQFSTRSLEPHEGDDADAVLSRAQAALGHGDLPGAVALVRQLPDAGVNEMSDWLGLAETRLGALAALDDFLAQ
ncbi:MAG: COG4223 family protein [Paracoccaceae bacterium]